MPELTCFRLLDAESPAGPLAEAVRQVNAGQGGVAVFALDPVSFEQIPNAPFAYWVEEKVRRLYKELPAFESEGRTARVGLQTGDDFRFVRCWWEVPIEPQTSPTRNWWPYAKGGAYAPYYADLHLVVNCKSDAAELRNCSAARVQNETYNFRPGLTWTHRTTSPLSFRVFPRDAVFGCKGPTAFIESGACDLAIFLGLLNSKSFIFLVTNLVGAADSAARQYDNGIINKMPVPPRIQSGAADLLGKSAVACWGRKWRSDTLNETSHAFVTPWWGARVGQLRDMDSELQHGQASLEVFVANQQLEINQISQALYGFMVSHEAPVSSIDTGNGVRDEDEGGSLDAARMLTSYLVGVAFGRWAIPVDIDELRKPPADPFAPLPAQAPGATPTEAAKLYFAEDASGESDLLNSCRVALRQATGLASVDDYEQDLAARLGVPTLRDYLSRPAGFFADHLSVYSKSRRKAPIYWPLSTRSGDFVLWVYYPKLDADSLPRLITEVLDPRLRSLNEEISSLVAEGRTAGRRGKLEALRLELSEMRQDFQELIAKGYKPNLNDGVLITACPLAKYFRHAGFRAKLEACWRELSRGDYDWSHLAMAMWPERVLAVCKKDRSIAIAHGREDLCPAEPPKVTRGRKKKTE